MKEVKEKVSSSMRDVAGFLASIFLPVWDVFQDKGRGRRAGTTAAAAAARIPDGDTRNDSL